MGLSWIVGIRPLSPFARAPRRVAVVLSSAADILASVARVERSAPRVKLALTTNGGVPRSVFFYQASVANPDASSRENKGAAHRRFLAPVDHGEDDIAPWTPR